jgi:hypothetical protein
MNCGTRTDEFVTGRRPMAGPAFEGQADERTRDRQAAAQYLRSAGDADDADERRCLRWLAARLVLSNPPD